MTRRGFLQATAAAVAAATPLGTVRAQAAVKGNGLHVFSKPLQWLGYDAMAELVAEAGLGGIDLSVRPKGHVEPERVGEDLPKAVEAARKQGLTIEMIEKLHKQMAALEALNKACGITGCYQNHHAWSDGLFGGPRVGHLLYAQGPGSAVDRRPVRRAARGGRVHGLVGRRHAVARAVHPVHAG